MRIYFRYLLITLLIGVLLTIIYFFINYEIPNMFYNKLQFSMISGFICIFIAVRFLAGNSSQGMKDLYISSRHNKLAQDERIKEGNPANPKFISGLALLTSGVIQMSFGLFIGKLGVL